MTDAYLVPAGYGEAELVEKRSRFIGRVWPVENEQEAVARVREMREKHWDATHNVYAYILREGSIMRYSDDGEPGGTSGMPTLNVFRAGDIKNVCCVVTRYFGGILLGAGGLVHAYSNTAKLALDAAGISRMDLWDELLISCNYSQYERVRRMLEAQDAILSGTDFGADVVIEALLSRERTGEFRDALREATAATALCEVTGTQRRAVRIK